MLVFYRKKFDHDIHIENAFILWPYKDVRRVGVIADVGTHGKSATVLTTRKRNPENWQKNRRKEALNQGLSGLAKNIMDKMKEFECPKCPAEIV